MKFTISIDDGEDLQPEFTFEVDGPLDEVDEFLKLCRSLEYDLDVVIDTNERDGISIQADEDGGPCLMGIRERARLVAEAIRDLFSPEAQIEETGPK